MVKRAGKIYLSVILFILLFAVRINSQVLTFTEGNYTYQMVENDPMKTRIYTLDNGLKVFLTVYKDEPRIQTYIPVKTGSKNDPSDATGLAHYLEHMLFKGTDKFGTNDYTKEKPLIDEIIALYEKHRSTKDGAKRKEIYRQIDSVSGIAAKYAIANEYDKLMADLGASGTNAYTWVEQTVYTNNIPSNQLEKWIMIEAERFRNPVMRLFHTELEAVYEEKNIGLDDDGDKAWEELFLSLYPTHPYGTQTTIGTIEDLKNPSIKKVIEYFNARYIPNNMAIVLSGDLDPQRTIELVDKYWGSKPKGVVPGFTPPVEKTITSPVVKKVYGPEAEYLMMGFRFPGANTRENDLVTMVDMVLANSAAGLLDLNLNQSQKVLSSGSFVMTFKDYSTHVLTGNARNGQKLEEVRDLLLEQIEKVKSGDFPDWLPEAIINDLKLSEMKSAESNNARADMIVNAFIKDIPWEDQVIRIQRLSKITKKDIVEFAKKNYGNNYAIVYKKTGEDKNVKKVEKPKITPVEVNRQDKSAFLKETEQMQTENIQPVFIDYNTDLTITSVKNDIPLLYKQNTENELFTLSFVIEAGGANDKRIPLAASYFGYLGTSKYSPSKLKEEFYKIGCSYSISSGDDQTAISLSGLNQNFDKAVVLLESVIADIVPDEASLKNMVSDIMKVREDAKLSQDKILWDAMLSYGKYGPKSSFTDILTEEQLRSIDPKELTAIIKNLLSYRHKILYYGPLTEGSLKEKLNTEHHIPDGGLKEPPKAVIYEELPTTDNNVYVVNYPEMVQAEILMLSKKGAFNKDLLPYSSMYNEYFGGGMSGIVFQEMRESKALAYSTFSSYSSPSKKDRSHYNIAYIGTQSDKLPEAVAGLFELMNNMPASENTFNSARNNIIQKFNTERITKSGILNSYLSAQKLGLTTDIRKDVYNAVLNMTIADIEKFQQENVKDSKYTILVLGDKNKLDMDVLSKYGKVKFLTLEEIFGY
jgi:predicted Zn-dependent peptidase